MQNLFLRLRLVDELPADSNPRPQEGSRQVGHRNSEQVTSLLGNWCKQSSDIQISKLSTALIANQWRRTISKIISQLDGAMELVTDVHGDESNHACVVRKCCLVCIFFLVELHVAQVQDSWDGLVDIWGDNTLVWVISFRTCQWWSW